jgi:predicted RNase H-like nuclease (RuvC/YqgF family)
MDVSTILAIVSTIFGGGSAVGWIVERKKNKAITSQEEGNALKIMQETYSLFTKDFEQKYETLKSENKDLYTQKDLLYSEVQKMKVSITGIQETMTKETVKYKELEKKYNGLDKKYNGLKEAYDKLKIQYTGLLNKFKENGTDKS